MSRVDVERRMTIEGIKEKFGAEEVRWLESAMLSAAGDLNDSEYECVDNMRLALKTDLEAVAEYDRIASTGCCGFADFELGPSPVTGNVYLWGFNHGH